MAEDKKKGFHMVSDSDTEEYKKKIREHRLKIMKRATVTVLVIFLIGAGISIFAALRHYESFDIRSSVERSDTDATRFAEFCGNILKYSNDGAFYTDVQNELIWNQTYEMSDPHIDMCRNYLVIYDKKGTDIYIMNDVGQQGSIETTMAIDQVCVASQGTIAVLMKKDDVGYLALYDKSGKNLAQGGIHGEKGGYPIAIALSHDAIKLAVSMIDINDGSVKTTLAFYNFGSVGQNEIDNCVGVNTYPDMVIPELKFVSDDRMIAVGDSKLLIFEGTQKPQLKTEVVLEKEAEGFFYNESYIGIIANNEGEAVGKHLTVYGTAGNPVSEKDIAVEYDRIEFLSNNEICILNDNICDIYTTRGIYKFHYEFDDVIYKIIPEGPSLNYTFVLGDATERVRLR